MGYRPVLFIDGVKPCCKCKRLLPPEAFHKTTSTVSGRTSRCSECRRETWNGWNQRNPERRRIAWQGWVKRNPRVRKNSLLLYNFGITIEQYDEMFLKQGGVCAICLGSKRLCVDHDHKTGKVRGLLCDPCNIMVGRSQDDISRLRSAIAYLEKHYD